MIDTGFRIETARLIIRPFAETDCEPMLRIQGNPEMVRYTPDDPWTGMNDAYGFLKFAQSLYQDVPTRDWFRYYFAVVEKASGEVIGYCGLGNPEFDISLTEVLYGINVPYWGKGYATEAAKALIDYGFRHLQLTKIVGFAETRNGASLRVLEKAGLRRHGFIGGLPDKFSYFNGECFFELTRDEWAAKPETHWRAEMDIVFELGTESDVDELEQLYDDLNDYLASTTNYPGWKKGIYPVRQDASDGIEERALYVARKNGRIVGSIILNHQAEPAYAQAKWGIDSNYADILVVHTFVVHPGFQKSGIGQRILNFSIDHGVRSQAKAIRLDVHEGNTPAIRLYEKCGFKYVATVDLGLGDYGLKWFRLYERLL